MRLCVQYAVTYPARLPGLTRELDLFSVGTLNFFAPDPAAFPLLPLAYRAMKLGGGVPAVLNASNEVAVAAFLREKINFTDISRTVSETVERLTVYKNAKTVEELLDADREARNAAAALL
jgi:1-deoxy-D-xylulose-5-phosphate reductoisomerase